MPKYYCMNNVRSQFYRVLCYIMCRKLATIASSDTVTVKCQAAIKLILQYLIFIIRCFDSNTYNYGSLMCTIIKMKLIIITN